MLKYSHLIVVLIISFFQLREARAQQLSDQAEVSVLTFGPGASELYSAFGHSAIRVNDPVRGIDIAFNYGTFDFDQPNFYLNFARGYLVYKLAVQDSKALLAYYKRNNRSIFEQVLALSKEQKEKVFKFLVNNAKPENANYYYDYFYDNCATKIGDVFVEALGEEFKFNESFVDEPGLTIRELTDRYSAEMYPWGKLGIDLCLGLPMDKQLSNLEYLYIPEYVSLAFAIAEVKSDGNWHSVIKNQKDIYKADQSSLPKPFFTPGLVFWSIFILISILSILAYRKGSSLKILDFLIYFLFGFLGLFFLLLWLATDHNAASWNLNLLWAWPTHLIAAFFLLKGSRPRWLNWYLLITLIFSLMLVLFWAIVPQALNPALIPLVLLLAVRSGFAIFE